MSEESSKTNLVSGWTVVVCVIVALSLLCNVIQWNEHSKEIAFKEYEISTLNKSLNNLTEKKKYFEDQTVILSTENFELRENLGQLTKRLEDIKNGDDLLRRDIFLYIDQKFSRVPDSVSKDIADSILTISKRENISPELIMGIIQVESSFNPMAISNKSARGLMQVMPAWAKKFDLPKVSDLHNIDTNIECGVRVLKIHIEESKGSLTKGLYHYVGKSDSYAGKVYQAMGQFIAFRSSVTDDENEEQSQPETEVESEAN